MNYDDTANRYSPLDQITPQNVATLQQAWSFHMKPAGFTGGLCEDEAIPAAYQRHVEAYRERQRARLERQPQWIREHNRPR